MKNILILLTFCFLTSSYGQNGTYERGGFSNVGTGSHSVIGYSELEGIKGHKYFTGYWTHGFLTINDSIKSPKPKLQYDLSTGDIILGGTDDKSGFAITDKSLTGFTIYKDNVAYNFVRKEASDFENDVDRNYFHTPFPLSKKHYLLVDFRKKLKEPKLSRNSYTTTNRDKEYKKSKRYYILKKNGKYCKIHTLKKNVILKKLKHHKHLKEYIKANNLNLKKEKDVHKLLEYYHSFIPS